MRLHESSPSTWSRNKAKTQKTVSGSFRSGATLGVLVVPTVPTAYFNPKSEKGKLVSYKRCNYFFPQQPPLHFTTKALPPSAVCLLKWKYTPYAHALRLLPGGNLHVPIAMRKSVSRNTSNGLMPETFHITEIYFTSSLRLDVRNKTENRGIV